MNSRVLSKSLVSTVAILLGFSTSAFAGPPLICHRIQIGQAKTLPLVDWNQKETAGLASRKRVAHQTARAYLRLQRPI